MRSTALSVDYGSSTGQNGPDNRPDLSNRRIWIWMDVSGTCNLACRDCYTKQSHIPVLVPPARFETILTKLADSGAQIEKLHLNWRGEPSTNKRLAELLGIRNAVLPGVPIEFHTNGVLVTEKLSNAVMANAIAEDLIYVSIDGGAKAAHEANRGDDTWEPTLRGLGHLLDARDRLDRDGPQIGIYEIFYDRRTPYDTGLIALSKRCDQWTRVAAIQLDGEESPFAAEDIPAGPCFWAGNALCITATGDAHICLLSFRPDGKMGNIFTDDLATIVGNATDFRLRLAEQGRSAVPHCRTCRKMEGEIDAP